MRSTPPENFDLSRVRDTLRRKLLAWFSGEARDLPWRRDRTPYRTWISEIMLQQTTVSTVIPYFLEFLERFPDVHVLASAKEEDVLACWSGLGYYRRARHLHRAARQVVQGHGGRLPASREDWRALPGIGPYASGAIASMAGGEVVPAVDANARRVITRWAVGDPARLSDLGPSRLERMAADLVDPDRPGDWNEAVMELGATICKPVAPRCEVCPVSPACEAFRAGEVSTIPAPKPRSSVTPVRLAMVLVQREGRVLLLPPDRRLVLAGPPEARVLRSDFSGLHHGLWTPPTTAWFAAREIDDDSWDHEAWWQVLSAHVGLSCRDVAACWDHLGGVSHAITKYRLGIDVWRLRLPAGAPVSEPLDGAVSECRGRFCEVGPAGPPVPSWVTKGYAVKGLTKG